MWKNIEPSPVEDETISNTFSSRGIFKMHSDEEVQSYPQVQASMQNKKMVIAIDKSLTLLEDELVVNGSYLSFDASIDVIAISHSGNLIVCGLSDGQIYGIFIKGISVFDLHIKLEDVHLTGRTFVSIQQLEERFYLSCSNGSVYRLSEIDESPLEAYLNISLKDNETTTSLDESQFEQPTMQRVSTGRGGLNGFSAAVLIPYCGCISEGTTAAITVDDDINKNTLLFIAGAHNALYFRNSTEDASRINLPEHFGGVKRLFNLENFILVLTNSGHLLEVCPLTRTFYLADSQSAFALLIDHLVITECSEENIELLVLAKVGASEDEGRVMKTIEYPSFECSSELTLSDHAWLVQQPKCSVNLYYMSGQNVSAAQIPTELEMMLVSETHPSERFKKLIAKGHLEEAEDFGKQFELCLQPIFEAKARRIFADLSTLDDNNRELLEQRFGELLALLQQIESKEFFRKNVMKTMPTRNLLERFLKEMLKHLDAEYDEKHILQVIEQLHRLRTLALIDPYECNMEWQKFVHHDNLLKIIITLFKSDIPTASLIWKRHSSAMMPQLNEEELRKCLGLVPNQTEAFNLVQWLRQFVPTVSQTHPNLMPFITEWSIQKTRTLQFTEHWPEIGLEFSTKVLEIFEEIQFMHSDMRRQLDCNIVKLREIVNALQDLVVLKKSYNLSFTLDNYLLDSIDDTALFILRRVHLDNLKGLVNNFLYPIFHEQGKSPVGAIRDYVSLLVANRNLLSTWLERSVACIDLLHNEDDRLECALLVLQSSPVPWPNVVTPLMKLRYSTHPLALKINTEYEIQVIKIMKVKYGWPVDSASDINLTLFMFRIVKMDLPDMLNDIRVLTKAAPEIATSANFNCCYQLVRRGKSEVAYEFFKNLHADKNSKSAQEVANLFAEILENSVFERDDKSIEEQRHLIEFYKLITPHASCRSAERRLLSIQHRFTLCHKFRLKVSAVSELIALKNRLELLDAGIENIIERSQATVNVSKFIASEVSELSTALEMQKMFGVRRICHRMSCLPLTCALAYAMLESVECGPANKGDFVDLALELIVQQIETVKSSSSTSSAAAMTFFNENDPLTFSLAYALLVSASLQERKQPQELLELLKYVRIVQNSYDLNAIESYYSGKERDVNEQICKALDAAEMTIGADSTLNYSSALSCTFEAKPAPSASKRRVSVSMFDEVDVQPQKKSDGNEQMSAIVKFVARTLLLMLIESEPTNGLLRTLRSLLSDATRNDTDGAHEAFFLSLEELIKAKKHDIWYIMALYLLDYQKYNKCKIINGDFVSLHLNRVFRNVMSHKEVNFNELFVMLISDNHTATLIERLKSDMKTDQQKVNLLTLLEKYNDHLEEYTQVETIRRNRIKHYYYMEFCKQDPSIKYKLNAEIDNVEQLLKEFHNKKLDVRLLERMSRDFGFDYQQLLITQVISILQAQEPQYEIKTDAFGHEELIMLSTVENMHELCQSYINEIKNTKLLASKLKNFITEINIYFYELYLCVIEILSFVDEELPKELQVWTSILQFLKHKMTVRRHSRPGQVDMWVQSQAEIGVLPKIARYRLPFMPIVEQPLKDILENELSVDNCESWFPLIQMHTVLKGSTEIQKIRDYFCLSVVKNSITEYRTNIDAETWHLQPTNNAFLKSILRLVKHVHSPSKVFMILYFVSNYAPDGADQVEASYECYSYACENEALIKDPKMQEQLVKIKRKYPILKTQHLLHVYGLTDDKLMRLVENPTELIYHLYHHELILKASSKLDINTVVGEIALLHKLDVEIIQFQLLQKWLAFTMEPSADGTVLEETFLEDHNLMETASEDAGNAAENVIRANYIFSSWPKKKAVQFLVAHIFSSDSSRNTSQLLQMYECFSKLNDGSSSFNDKLRQSQYITIKCVHELKQLGYNSSPEKFASCNKIDILKTIWQRNAQNPHTLELLANICLGFDIYLARIWNGILKRMVMFNMVRELNALVDVLSCRTELLQTEGLAAAWTCVLKQPFNNANQTRSFAQEETLHKTLFRLQSCPVIHKLPLLEFAEQCCIQLDRPHIAAIFIGLSSNHKLREDIKKLIATRKTPKMRKEILELEDAGILSVVLNFTLKELHL